MSLRICIKNDITHAAIPALYTDLESMEATEMGWSTL